MPCHSGLFSRSFERLHPVRYAFRIVEPIDAEDEPVPAQALAHQLDHRRAPRIAGEAHVGLGLDADREGAETHLLPFEFIAGSVLRRALRHQVVSEIVVVVLRLEADQIVVGEAAEDFPVVRQGLQDVRRRAWRVKEKPDRVAVAPRAQLASSNIR